MAQRTPLFNAKLQGGIHTLDPAALATGSHWFVGSTVTGASDASGFGTSPDSPFATVDYAFSSGAVTASKGDIIWVMPGHAETATTDVEIFDMDLAGVSIIGLGVGNLRPTFNLEHADCTCVVGAANCRISNCRFICGVSDLVTMIDVEATGDGLVIDHCYFADTATDEDALIMIYVTAAANNLKIVDNLFVGITGGEATDCIYLKGASNGTIIAHNMASGDWKTGGFINCATAASVNMMFIENWVVNQEADAGLCLLSHASNTGLVADNSFAGNKANTEPISTVTAMHVSQNYMTDAVAATGIISATITAW